MLNDKLLNCPFCDKKLKRFKGGYEHKSSQCVLSSFILTDVEIPKWNVRRPMERIVEQLENHKNCYEKVIGQVIVDNYDINLERVDLMNCAIDIVRKGGVDNAG